MNERMYKVLKIPGYKVIPINLPRITKHSTIKDVISHCKNQIKETSPIFLGICSGGLIAIELAQQISPSKLILVSSVKNKSELTFGSKTFATLYLFFPERLQKLFGLSLKFVLNKVLNLKIKVPRLWLKDAQNKFIVRLALKIKTPIDSSKLLHLHGEKDKIIPIHKIENPIIIKNAGHFMYLKNRKSVMEAIHKNLNNGIK